MEGNFLEIKDLKKSFGTGEARQDVLRGMNFTVKKGEFCVLLGPSGSGKSTLLNIIGGIDTPDSGFVSIRGDKLEDMDEKQLTIYRRKHLGYVFQMYNLIPNLNVKENIEVGAYLSENPLNVEDVITTLGLQEHKYKYPNQLSGGQQQRVAIARALATKPSIILADEPTGNLDSKTSQDVLGLMKTSCTRFRQTLIMITHNEEIAQMADRIIRIEDGRVVMKGGALHE
jgi:putative ABC transport system ATP-binding protein